MTQSEKIIRAKLGLLELAKQLGNVSRACQIMGRSPYNLIRSPKIMGAWFLADSAAQSERPIVLDRDPERIFGRYA